MSWHEHCHDMLALSLVVLRPLIWGGDAAAWDSIAFLALVLLGLTLLLWEGWQGRRQSWRWNWGGALLAGVVVVLLPAAIRAPDPSLAWGWWGMLVIHLGFAGYLMQVIQGRERLVFAGVLSSLVVECGMGVLQKWWVLPDMADALRHGDEQLLRIETSHGDLAERIRNGGVFATFTLANNFAAYLLVTLIPLFGSLCVRGSPAIERSAWLCVLLIGLACIALTGAKGAVLVVILAAGLLWLISGSARWRWGILPLGLAVVLFALGDNSLHRALAASAEVRLGYWQGAAHLIAQAPLIGSGIGTFAQQSALAMPLSAEPTRYVHNEVLEIWLDGGLLAGILLVLSLIRVAWVPQSIWPSEHGLARWIIAIAPFIVVMPLFCLLGTCASCLDWLGGLDDSNRWARAVLGITGLVMAGVLCTYRLPKPPAWAWRVALLAVSLHCLIDFDLHCPGLLGMLIIIGCLCAGPARIVSARRSRLVGMTMLIVALSAGLGFGCRRAMQLHDAQALCADVAVYEHSTSQRSPASVAAINDLWQRTQGTDQPTEAYGNPKSVAHVMSIALAQAHLLAERWPACMYVIVQATGLSPPGGERLGWSKDLVSELPNSAVAYELLAEDRAALGQWDAAMLAMQEAVRLAPANLARRADLARLFEQSATALPARADHLLQQAKDQRAEMARLHAIVNPRNWP